MKEFQLLSTLVQAHLDVIPQTQVTKAIISAVHAGLLLADRGPQDLPCPNCTGTGTHAIFNLALFTSAVIPFPNIWIKILPGVTQVSCGAPSHSKQQQSYCLKILI